MEGKGGKVEDKGKYSWSLWKAAVEVDVGGGGDADCVSVTGATSRIGVGSVCCQENSGSAADGFRRDIACGDTTPGGLLLVGVDAEVVDESLRRSMVTKSLARFNRPSDEGLVAGPARTVKVEVEEVDVVVEVVPVNTDALHIRRFFSSIAKRKNLMMTRQGASRAVVRWIIERVDAAYVLATCGAAAESGADELASWSGWGPLAGVGCGNNTGEKKVQQIP